jgi:hypothetical protein
MNVVRNPRCPEHPEYVVGIDRRDRHHPVVWKCSICMRPLGVATVHDVFYSSDPIDGWPLAKRRVVASKLHWSRCDLEWLLLQGIKERTERLERLNARLEANLRMSEAAS